MRVWDGRTGKFVATLRGHIAAVYRLAWSADSRLLVSASKDSTLKVSLLLVVCGVIWLGLSRVWRGSPLATLREAMVYDATSGVQHVRSLQPMRVQACALRTWRLWRVDRAGVPCILSTLNPLRYPRVQNAADVLMHTCAPRRFE